MRLTSLALMVCASLLVTTTVPAPAAPPSEREVSKNELLAEKQGHVVDAATGQPISGALVVINWVTNSSGVPDVASGGQWCNLQEITSTDADGEFSIEAVNEKLDMSNVGTFNNVLPWGSASALHQMSYRMYVYKPGYVLVGDEQKVQAAKYGAGVEWDSVPEVTSNSSPVVIAPVRLKHSNLDAEGQWIYAALLDSASRCRDRMAENKDAPRWHEFREQLRTGITSLPCKMPADAMIQPASTNALRRMIANKRFEARLVVETGGDVRVTRMPIRADQLCRATTELTGAP